MAKILSPVLNLKGQWMLGYIENHTARPMSKEEIELHIEHVLALEEQVERLEKGEE